MNSEGKDGGETRDLSGYPVDDYLYDCLQVEPLALQEEYIRVIPDLARWNMVYADALKEFQLAKLEFDNTESSLYIKCREQLLADHGKVTESFIEAKMKSDEEYQTARRNMILAEAKKSKIGGVCDAIRTKRDMLVSLGAHVRAELQGDPMLRAEHRNQRARTENR